MVLNLLEKNLEKIPYGKIFINIFPQSLELQKIVELLNRVAEKAYKWGKFLVSELTEYAGINHLEIFEKLNLKKLHLAFDDFGSGYTNFQMVGNILSRYKSSFVKVDGSVVRNITVNPIYRSIEIGSNLLRGE